MALRRLVTVLGTTFLTTSFLGSISLAKDNWAFYSYDGVDGRSYSIVGVGVGDLTSSEVYSLGFFCSAGSPSVHASYTTESLTSVAEDMPVDLLSRVDDGAIGKSPATPVFEGYTFIIEAPAANDLLQRLSQATVMISVALQVDGVIEHEASFSPEGISDAAEKIAENCDL